PEPDAGVLSNRRMDGTERIAELMWHLAVGQDRQHRMIPTMHADGEAIVPLALHQIGPDARIETLDEECGREVILLQGIEDRRRRVGCWAVVKGQSDLIGRRRAGDEA